MICQHDAHVRSACYAMIRDMDRALCGYRSALVDVMADAAATIEAGDPLGFGPDDVAARFEACPALTAADAAALAGRWRAPGLAASDSIRWAQVRVGGGRFEFPDEAHDDGEAAPAIIVMCLDDGRVACDLAAIPLSAPATAARWLGRADLLGGEALATDGPVRAFRTPLDWLRAGRTGIVVLDAGEARWRLAGRDLVAQDVEHGRWLRDALALPRPRVMVAASAGRAA